MSFKPGNAGSRTLTLPRGRYLLPPSLHASRHHQDFITYRPTCLSFPPTRRRTSPSSCGEHPTTQKQRIRAVHMISEADRQPLAGNIFKDLSSMTSIGNQRQQHAAYGIFDSMNQHRRQIERFELLADHRQSLTGIRRIRIVVATIAGIEYDGYGILFL